ncbi:MAG: PIN domain nuclease [Planctomycetota bacterium]|nr:PIN domain nuclease [Planctomycetota bacterium]
MKKLKLYLETSVWNFSFATDSPEHRKSTQLFLEQVLENRFSVYISRLVLDEISRSPQPKQDSLLNLIGKHKPFLLEPNEEINQIADEYIKRGIIPVRYLPDALHIAYTVAADLDVLVSWNFAHLVRTKTRREVNGTNLLLGYKQIEICSPEEVIIYDL